MPGRECYHCKQWIEEGESHDCWTTTEAALTEDLSEDLQDAWQRLRDTAADFGEQRVYASHRCIMFSRRTCYFFVRPKRQYLEVCFFLGRALAAPRVTRVERRSKTKIGYIIRITHRDEVEPPVTDWLREAYDLQDALATAATGTRAARATPKREPHTGATMRGNETARSRCAWARTPLGIAYHDAEWGVPVHDDRTLFEFLVLEGAQAGLSWETILGKREAYREAFAGFDPQRVARFTPARIERLLGNAGIVRNRLKIESAVRNAKAFLEVQSEFGSFDKYVWRFVGGEAAHEPLDVARHDTSANTGVRRAQPGPAATRLPVRRVDDLLCVHAGCRPCQRPHGRLLQAPKPIADAPRLRLPVLRPHLHDGRKFLRRAWPASGGVLGPRFAFRHGSRRPERSRRARAQPTE